MRIFVSTCLVIVWLSLHSLLGGRPLPFIVVIGIAIVVYGLVERIDVEIEEIEE